MGLSGIIHQAGGYDDYQTPMTTANKIDPSDERLIKLSYKHYLEWLAFENEKDSPTTWLCGSFATVRALLRLSFEQYPAYGKELLSILEKDIEEFKRSVGLHT